MYRSVKSLLCQENWIEQKGKDYFYTNVLYTGKELSRSVNRRRRLGTGDPTLPPSDDRGEVDDQSHALVSQSHRFSSVFRVQQFVDLKFYNP